jgi:hypothetical protein
VPYYRINRSIPARLDYGSASYALEIVKQRHDVIPMDQWVLRARKLQRESVCVLAWAIPYRSRLEAMLAVGFPVDAGSPAAQIMARLVRDGVAEQITEREARR